MGVSSANPCRLTTYSADGLLLVDSLRVESEAVAAALSALRRSTSPSVPELGESDATFADLVGDWRHLDEFAGDVARGFLAAAGHLDPALLTPEQRNRLMIRNVEDSTLGQYGQVGYADRDTAIAEATRLVDDMKAAWDDGEISAEELEAWSERAALGQYDPAFAVTFVEAMGPSGMAKVPAMIEDAWPGEFEPGEGYEHPGWGQTMLTPFAMILSTAMDSRAATADGGRLDADNATLDEQDRLDESWVDRFAEYEGGLLGPGSDLHYSLLVEQATLPSDVLVDIGNAHVSPYLAEDHADDPFNLMSRWGVDDFNPTVNLLSAIGANEDASLGWLTATADGQNTDNTRLLLGYDPGRYPGTDMGQAVATVLDNGLQHPDPRSDDVFASAVETVASEGEVHYDELIAVLGDGARTHIDQLAAATSTTVTRPGDALPGDRLFQAHDFLKVLMEDDSAARSVYQGAAEYTGAQAEADLGDGFADEATRIGGLMGLVTEADENAAIAATGERIAARQAFLNQLGLVQDFVGLIPVEGAVASNAISLGNSVLSHITDEFGMAGLDGAINQDYEDIARVRLQIEGQITATMANYEYAHQPSWNANDIAAASGGNFFVDGADPRRPIKPLADMSDDELAAYNRWIDSSQVINAINPDRTVWGQRMDEVVNKLEERS